MQASDAAAANAYWGRTDLERRILDALAAAGKDLDALTIEDLGPADHFHGGGKAATDRLARLAHLSPGLRVLDVGGGLGGPARTLAVEHGCDVTVIDLTESFVRTGEALTARLGLFDRVRHRVGDALALDVGDAAFDVIWTQNSGMNIADKERLYAGFARALRPGGRVVLQEPMAGPVQPVVFPVMWARDSSSSFLRTPQAMRAVMEGAGFAVRAWDDVTGDAARPTSAAGMPPHSAPPSPPRYLVSGGVFRTRPTPFASRRPPRPGDSSGGPKSTRPGFCVRRSMCARACLSGFPYPSVLVQIQLGGSRVLDSASHDTSPPSSRRHPRPGARAGGRRALLRHAHGRVRRRGDQDRDAGTRR